MFQYLHYFNTYLMNIKGMVILLLTMIIFQTQSYGRKIPRLKLRQQFSTQNGYVKLLGLEDEHALVIKYFITSSWNTYPYDTFIAYTNSGKVYRCELPSNSDKGYCLKKQEIVGDNLRNYMVLLTQIADSNMLDINSSLLNSIEVQIDSLRWEVVYSIIDASGITIEIAQDNRHEFFSSYAPDYYSKLNCRGAKDMRKMMKLFDHIRDLSSRQFDEDLLALKNRDTVYVYFDGRREGQRKRYSRWMKDSWWYVYATSGCDSIMFEQTPYQNIDAITRNQMSDVRVVSESFLEKNKSVIFDHNFIIKYDQFFKNAVRRKKTIYLIEESFRMPGEIILQQVYPLFFDD